MVLFLKSYTCVALTTTIMDTLARTHPLTLALITLHLPQSQSAMLFPAQQVYPVTAQSFIFKLNATLWLDPPQPVCLHWPITATVWHDTLQLSISILGPHRCQISDDFADVTLYQQIIGLLLNVLHWSIAATAWYDSLRLINPWIAQVPRRRWCCRCNPIPADNWVTDIQHLVTGIGPDLQTNQLSSALNLCLLICALQSELSVITIRIGTSGCTPATSLQLQVYANADLAGDRDDRNSSYSGYIAMLGLYTICWRTQKHSQNSSSSFN